MTYTFFRKDGFYFIDLNSDEEAIANAVNNPGTIRVENTATIKTVFDRTPASLTADDK